MSLITNSVYRFGPYELDVDGVVLRRGKEVVDLTPKAFDLLSALVAAQGEVVTKEQLLQSVWPDSFVEEGNLSQGVFVLRRKLGETPEGQDYIQTVPRRGYRFGVAVERVERAMDRTGQGGSAAESYPFPAESDLFTAKPGSEADGTKAQFEHSPVAAKVGHGWVIWAVPAGVVLVAAVVVALLLGSMKVAKTVSSYTQLTQDGMDKRGRTASLAGPSAALATDGSRVYFTEGSADSSRLMQVSTAGGETMEIATPIVRPQLFDYSPSRSELLVGGFANPAAAAELWAVPVPAGVPHRIGDLEALDAAWSPDGKEIVYVSGTELSGARADGEAKRKIATLPGVGWRPKVSPDGSVIRLTVVDADTGEHSLWEVGRDGSGLHKLLPDSNGPHEECCGAWGADGNFVFQATRDSKTELWSLGKAELWERLLGRFPLPNEVTAGPGDMLAPASGPENDTLFALGEQMRGESVRFNSSSGKFESFLDGSSMDFVTFSRDGRWMAYVLFPQGTLWRSKADGSERLQLTFSPMRVMVPSWAPDGGTLAFYGYGAGRRLSVFTIAREGGVPQPISGRGGEMSPSWSPDGSRILFSDFPFFGMNPKDIAIHVLERTSGAITDIPGAAGLISPQWSPDGRYVAALTLSGRRIKLFDFKTGRWIDFLEGSGLLKWSHDGEWLYFMQAQGKGAIMRARVGTRDMDSGTDAQSNRKVEQVVSLAGFRQGGRLPGLQFSLDPDDAPILLKDTGVQEIYAIREHLR